MIGSSAPTSSGTSTNFGGHTISTHMPPQPPTNANASIHGTTTATCRHGTMHYAYGPTPRGANCPAPSNTSAKTFTAPSLWSPLMTPMPPSIPNSWPGPHVNPSPSNMRHPPSAVRNMMALWASPAGPAHWCGTSTRTAHGKTSAFPSNPHTAPPGQHAAGLSTRQPKLPPPAATSVSAVSRTS